MKNIISRIAPRIAKAAAALSLGFTGSAQAQEAQTLPTPVPDQAVAASELELGGPALWKVADEDTTIYMFGTVHVLPNETEWLNAPIQNALDASDEFVTEIDIAAAAAAGPDMVKAASLPEGQTLRSLLKPEDKAAYEAAMTGLGVPVAAFDQFEPWFAAMNMGMIPLLQKGYNPESGVEQVLTTSVGDGKKKAALETFAYQIELFDGLPIPNQAAYLRQVVDAIPKTAETVDTMVAEWLEGDADALGKILNESMGDANLYERFLTNRNANWADWIDWRLDQPGTVFMAVGAGHLAGEGSVQDKLAERGFEVTRVQ